jgi:hypothetical protein
LSKVHGEYRKGKGSLVHQEVRVFQRLSWLFNRTAMLRKYYLYESAMLGILYSANYITALQDWEYQCGTSIEI